MRISAAFGGLGPGASKFLRGENAQLPALRVENRRDGFIVAS